MKTSEIVHGTECLIKRPKQGRFEFHGYEYTHARVTRTTDASVFVKAGFEGAKEIRFNKKDLMEHTGGRPSRRLELVVDPAAIAKALAEQEAEKARKELEAKALVAVADLRRLFDQDRVHGRTASEIEALVRFRDEVCAESK
jgi:hypothetical protein